MGLGGRGFGSYVFVFATLLMNKGVQRGIVELLLRKVVGKAKWTAVVKLHRVQ